MKFPEGNEISYFHDHWFHSGVPSDIDFKTEVRSDGTIELVADRYGTKEYYGNGSILVSLTNAKSILRTFEKDLGSFAYDLIKAEVKKDLMKKVEEM